MIDVQPSDIEAVNMLCRPAVGEHPATLEPERSIRLAVAVAARLTANPHDATSHRIERAFLCKSVDSFSAGSKATVRQSYFR